MGAAVTTGALGSTVGAGPGVPVGLTLAVGAGEAVGSVLSSGMSSMLPLRIGNADDAETGIGSPVSMPMNGVIRLNWQLSSTVAGAPMPVPSPNVGAEIGDSSVQLMFDASVSMSRSYSSWMARLYGSVQAVGFMAA